MSWGLKSICGDWGGVRENEAALVARPVNAPGDPGPQRRRREGVQKSQSSRKTLGGCDHPTQFCPPMGGICATIKRELASNVRENLDEACDPRLLPGDKRHQCHVQA